MESPVRCMDSPMTIFKVNLDTTRPKVHWSVDNSLLFPRKLYEAANAGGSLITWNDKGNGVLIDYKRFESEVMDTYPDLVVIPTFANIRRQFREYGYEWVYLEDTDEFMFTHQFFRNGQPDLLDMVVTRRKRARVGWGSQHSGQAKAITKSTSESRPFVHHESIGERMRKSSSALSRKWPVINLRDNYSNRCLFSGPDNSPQSVHSIRTPKLSVRIVDSACNQLPTKRPVGRPRKYPIGMTPMSSTVPKSSTEVNKKQSGKDNFRSTRSEEDMEADFEQDLWNNCMPHFIQQDPDLQAAFDISCLESSMLSHHQDVSIPVYFHGDGYDYNPVTSHHMTRVCPPPYQSYSDYPVCDWAPYGYQMGEGYTPPPETLLSSLFEGHDKEERDPWNEVSERELYNLQNCPIIHIRPDGDSDIDK